MKFGNYTPDHTDAGNGLSACQERYLFQFDNGLTASVVRITADIYAEAPETYKPEEIGTWELAVTVLGLPLPMLESVTGQRIADPLGSDVGEGDPSMPESGIRWNLNDEDVVTLLGRVEAARVAEAA